MRILISTTEQFFPYWSSLVKELERNEINCYINRDYFIPIYSRNFFQHFKWKYKSKKILENFRPDVVIVDSAINIATHCLKKKIPFLLYLRGDIWRERKEKLESLKSFHHRMSFQHQWKEYDKCLENCKVILSVSEFLKNIINAKYPNKPIQTLYPGLKVENRYCQNGLSLKHPCVGILQRAQNWKKTRELLLLSKILSELPSVYFYWVGDGPYRTKIISELEKFENFTWLGKLESPNEVKKFLSEIDIYALFSGFDTLALTTIEAEFMKKPVIISKVGGTPETIINNETGFLIDLGDSKEWVKSIEYLIKNKELAQKMGISGNKFVKEKFDLTITAYKLIKICKKLTD